MQMIKFTINKDMFKKFTLSDTLMLVSAFLSLIFSEYLWFKGEKEADIYWFMGALYFRVCCIIKINK